MALIRTGGEADQLGGHYEALWRLKLLMELIAGSAEVLEIESFDRSLRNGVDAEVQRREGERFVSEFHSVKRQTAADNWTSTALLSGGSDSVVGRLLEKIEGAIERRFVIPTNSKFPADSIPARSDFCRNWARNH